MTGTAIAMMIVAITTVWGGLAASIIYLVTHPSPVDIDEE
ncbi:MAG: methionine/alanine import family NSS transporter small subunit [Bowdeniella nasicola]|nr:methionine/alanine import family NSS transporter small subunit [Bowdeniella nasicola]